MRAPAKKRVSRSTPPTISARLSARITLQTHADGSILACFDGHSVGLGKYSAATCKRAQELRSGLPLASFETSGRAADQELDLLVRRLARHGLMEYRLGRSRDEVVIEPQVADYWPRIARFDDSETLVLSRFAYLRRRGNDMVLESARAGALLRICNPKITTALARLAAPQRISRFRRQDGFPGLELLCLLVDCQILFKVNAAAGTGLRLDEGDDDLVPWDFHDLLFHTRSTEGRQANPLGGLYPFVG
ncbi:MAG: dehydrogenase, partial [Alphaproteobacteria bacterium]